MLRQAFKDNGPWALCLGTVPFGHAYDKERIEHPENWPIARRMFLDLLALDMNVSAFVQAGKSNWTYNGISTWVKKPMLRGIVRHQKEGIKPVITSDEWATAGVDWIFMGDSLCTDRYRSG